MTTRPPSLRALRTVLGLMIAGTCVAGGAVLFSAEKIGARTFANPLVGEIVAGIAVCALIAQSLVPSFLGRPVAVDESSQLRTFGRETLLRVAVLEAGLAISYFFYLLTVSDW